MRPLDSLAGLGEGTGAVDLAVVLDPEAVEGHPHRGRPQAGGRRQHLLPVLAGGQRHPGGGKGLELGRADVVGEQPQQLSRLGMGGQLVHRVGAESEHVVVAEPVDLLQHPGDVVDRHGRVGDALSPAVAAHRRAAHHLDVQPELHGHPGRQYLPALVACQATLPPPPSATSSTRCGRAPAARAAASAAEAAGGMSGR
jgi:hypothetical protein